MWLVGGVRGRRRLDGSMMVAIVLGYADKLYNIGLNQSIEIFGLRDEWSPKVTHFLSLPTKSFQ